MCFVSQNVIDGRVFITTSRQFPFGIFSPSHFASRDPKVQKQNDEGVLDIGVYLGSCGLQWHIEVVSKCFIFVRRI
jgi:hypothetical protein